MLPVKHKKYEADVRYTVFADGTVIGPKKTLTPFEDAYGYLGVRIKGRTIKLHRLIAETFIPNPDNKPQVNHIDGNKRNNQVNNLEWCTAKYNIHHAFANRLISREGAKNSRAKLDEADVRFIRSMKYSGLSTREIGDVYGVSRNTIQKILTRTTWKHVL